MFSFFCSKKKLINTGIFKGATDWHSHILPGVDDGIQTLEDSLDVLAYYEKIGIRKHCNESRQGVVVAESAVVHDLARGNGVVFVYDRNDLLFYKSFEGVADVGFGELIRQIILR